MRILMLNNEFPPLGGGTGTVNRALLERWVKAPNIEIDLITAAPGKVEEQEQFSETVRVFRVPVNNHDIHHASNRELVTYAARALVLAVHLQRREAYDFCFAWSVVPAGAIARLLRCFTGLTYIVRVCGPDIPGFERRYGRLYILLKPLIRATWQAAAFTVAKCEGETAMIRAVDSSVAISLVPNGVDRGSFAPAANIPNDGPLRLLCVARLIERKGQHHLIEAVKQLTDQGVDVSLDLVGTGDARRSNEGQVEELGLNNRVRFRGYVPREEIPKHYSAAHVFVLPSYNEGMSVATLEAMAAGLPIVVTRTGGTAELVEEGVNGLTFDWSDIPALVAHLKKLATHREIARAMGAASRTRSLQFTWDDASARYLEMFSALAKRNVNGTIKLETLPNPDASVTPSNI